MTLSDAQVRAVEEAFGGLVGLPLIEVVGPSHWVAFDFAELRTLPAWGALPGGRKAMWTLSAFCAWRIDAPGESSFDGKDIRRSRRSSLPPRGEALEALLKAHSLIVEKIVVRKDGGLRLTLSQDYILTVLPRGEFDLQLEIMRGDRRWTLSTPEDDPRGDLFFLVGDIEWRPKMAPPMYVDYFVE